MAGMKTLQSAVQLVAMGMGLAAGQAHGSQVPVADTVLTGGPISTLSVADPEVRALAIKDGRITAVGSETEIARRIGPDTEVIALEGRRVVPGFIEGHGHFLGVGEARMQLDLRTATSWEDVVAQVAEAAKRIPEGTLIRGRGWHQEKWEHTPPGAVEGLPVHASLSAVSPQHPVLLRHASGHMVFANQKAMDLCGLGFETPDPSGGTVVRDPEGNPTGALRESAAGLVAGAEARARPIPLKDKAEQAMDECLAKGITSFQIAGTSLRRASAFKAMALAGELRVRLWVMLNEPVEILARAMPEARVVGVGDHHLTVAAIKRTIDGALGSHGAWLLEPYTDLPDTHGLRLLSPEQMEAVATLALEHDLQLCVHAIGDHGNREVLDVYQRAFDSLQGGETRGADRRWRIEHAQHLHPDDLPRFARMGVIASMQAIHCVSDGPWVPSRIGPERSASGAYRALDLLRSGAVVTQGTDAPVEDVDPLANFRAAVTRRMKNGEIFEPGQRMTREQALRAATLNAAYAAFEDKIKGSLEPGKLADMVVLSHDILTMPAEELGEARVELTLVGGEVRYRAR
ncbi:amidohydrolase [Candidatus Woesearchaeota archaeon]|nr:amidohydrolase [Candidatus Woesearchaeota archaeon]